MEEAAGPAHVAFHVPAPPDLPHSVLAPADPTLVLDAVSAPESCELVEAAGLAGSKPSDTFPQAVSQGDAPAPHPAQGTDLAAPLDSTLGLRKDKRCTVKNDLTVSVEVCLNGERDCEWLSQWHVLYPQQVKAIEYDGTFDPEVSVLVRLRENYDIHSKICINDVSEILSVPQRFQASFHDAAKEFIYNQDKGAKEECRLSDERRETIQKKMNDAINRAGHRRQGCIYLCTAMILSVLLGLLTVCTVASFALDYDAPEQYGLGVALVLVLYCACAARNGFIGGTKGLSYHVQHRLKARGAELTGYVADGFSPGRPHRLRNHQDVEDNGAECETEWNWRWFISKCCGLCVKLITFVCAAVFFVGSAVRSVEASNGENWWIIVILLIPFMLCSFYCLCACFGPDNFHEDRRCILLQACVLIISAVGAMVVVVHGWLRAPKSGSWMPPPFFGWTCLLMLGLGLVICYTRTQDPMRLVAWCFGTEIVDFEASLVAPTRSSLDATMLGVHQGTIVFEGSVLPNVPTIVSWPGKYESKWDSLVNEAKQKEISAAVVFLPEGSKHFGVHDFVPRKYDLKPPREYCQCWCYWLYGEQKPWGCRWWTRWVDNIENAVKNGNTLEVYFFDDKRGEGKVKDFKAAGEEHGLRETILKKENIS